MRDFNACYHMARNLHCSKWRPVAVQELKDERTRKCIPTHGSLKRERAADPKNLITNTKIWRKKRFDYGLKI